MNRFQHDFPVLIEVYATFKTHASRLEESEHNAHTAEMAFMAVMNGWSDELSTANSRLHTALSKSFQSSIDVHRFDGPTGNEAESHSGFDIHIHFADGRSPQDCFDSYFELQTFKSNAVGNEDHETERIEKKWIKDLPESLMIHTQGGTTVFDLGSHPTLVINEKHSDEASKTPVVYTLCGAVCLCREHYIAYILDQESKQWVYVNDLYIDPVALECHVTKGSFNMHIYQKAKDMK